MLGKRDARHDPRDLVMAHYELDTLPAAPSSVAMPSGPWPMFWNDAIGDCAIACPGHEIEAWGRSSKLGTDVAASAVLAAYEAISGYKPADPKNPTTNETDVGCVVNDVLNYWRHIGIGNDKITGYVKIDVRSDLELRQAIWLFGGVYLGLSLPASAQAEVGRVWTVHHGTQGEPGTWGGHAVPLLAYSTRRYYGVTWGAQQAMTPGFVHRYADEAFAVLSADWIASLTHKAANGFDFATLQADLGKFS